MQHMKALQSPTHFFGTRGFISVNEGEKKAVRMTAVPGQLTRLVGLDVMDTLVAHMPWSCHSQDLLGLFHHLQSAVLLREPHLIACVEIWQLLRVGREMRGVRALASLHQVQLENFRLLNCTEMQDMNDLKAQEPL